jgi:hypothetical protein
MNLPDLIHTIYIMLLISIGMGGVICLLGHDEDYPDL